MKVVEKGSAWILYAEGEAIFLEALCSHGAVDYNFFIELNSEERHDYKKFGSEYLSRLSYEIHYSAPGVIGNCSIYKERCVSKQYIDQFAAAYSAWRKQQA
ncbi:MAG TPA: hypothetical protein VN030_07485 [Cellvibrio sp.]|nr:hypothetical protein [Cellvibrio sp.]